MWRKYQMKMKNNIFYAVLVLLSFLILCGMLWCTFQLPKEVIRTDTIYSTRTDTVWRDTTITVKELVPKEVIKKKVDTLYLNNGDTMQLITESKRYDKRLISGKDTADVNLYVSGINTSLDSLKWRLKTHTDIVTNTIEITKYIEKKKTFWDRFHIGVGVGYGIGLKNKDFEPFVGVSLTYGL